MVVLSPLGKVGWGTYLEDSWPLPWGREVPALTPSNCDRTPGLPHQPSHFVQSRTRFLPFTLQGLPCPDDELQAWNSLGKSLLRLLVKTSKGRNKADHKSGKSRPAHRWTAELETLGRKLLVTSFFFPLQLLV